MENEILVMSGDDYKRMQEQFNKDTDTFLMYELLYNEAKLEIERLHAKLKMSNYHLFKFLDETESAFDVNEKFESPEICLEYIDASLYCKSYFGRKINRIKEAREWYDNQTI